MEVKQDPKSEKPEELKCPYCGNAEPSGFFLCYVNVTEYHHIFSAENGVLSTQDFPEVGADKESSLALLCVECGNSSSADGWEIEWA